MQLIPIVPVGFEMVIDATPLVGYLPSHSRLARLKKIIVILNSGDMIKRKLSF